MTEYTAPHDLGYQSPYAAEEPFTAPRTRDAAMNAAGEQLTEAFEGARQAFCRFAREQPEVTAICCLGIGFMLGWKLKPW